MLKKLILSVASIVALSGFAAQAQETPDDLIRRSTNEILAALKADKDLQAGNQQKIEKLAEEKVLPYFNFTRMTQLAVGRNWREASDAQKKSLIDEFRTLLIRTYSTSLTQYRNQTIDVKPLKVSARLLRGRARRLLRRTMNQLIDTIQLGQRNQVGWQVNVAKCLVKP